MRAGETRLPSLSGAVALAGLWLVLAGCGREAAADKSPLVAEARPGVRTEVRTAPPKKKRDPAETIEWRDGRFATVWDPGD